MKKILAVLFTLVAAALWVEAATAPETYSTTLALQSSVDKLDMGRKQNNQDSCSKGSLPATCTQAQICVAINVPGGASCTVADALAAGVRIYADTTVGRQAFIGDQLVRKSLDEFANEQRRRDMAAFRAWCASASQAAKNIVCGNVGMAAGCAICD